MPLGCELVKDLVLIILAVGFFLRLHLGIFA